MRGGSTGTLAAMTIPGHEPEYPIAVDHDSARYGWSSSFPAFRDASARQIRGSLVDFVREAGAAQIRAWDESIPPLQREVGEVLDHGPDATRYSAILEYELPLEHRRPDVILLMGGGVLVLELKGKSRPERADIDQAAGYARDLRGYHRDCADRPVHAALVLTRATGRIGEDAGVHVVGLDAIDGLADELDSAGLQHPIDPSRFLAAEAYRPLPTLVQAARELFERELTQTGALRRVRRSIGNTAAAFDAISEIITEAARTRTRRLILLTGLPGAGKTLVGLQIAHAGFLDELAIPRDDGRPTAPAVFLSGNAPLVQVLQYELAGAGGGGKTFVRDVKPYVERYARSPSLTPAEHVVIFDEAQRAWDEEKVAAKHDGSGDGKSEPDHFIEFAGRLPEWCVVIGLVGTGQEIHEGEEAGLGQWKRAVDRSIKADEWLVHGPPGVADAFGGDERCKVDARLHLDAEIRFHRSREVHAYVAAVLGREDPTRLAALATRLEAEGYHLRIARDLNVAKHYLRERYGDQPEARFGLVASSRDSDLPRFGVPNDWNSTRRLRYGPWFAEGDGDYLGRSCRALRECVTEFGIQGLELDAALLAWGTDFFLEDGAWTNRLARPYSHKTHIRDAHQLRVNAYRVLLTRGRDGTLVFVPPIPALDKTFEYLTAAGFRSVDDVRLERDATGRPSPR